ncbi:hypothetical protein THAR02_06755 [Trichoderma harzianum]|uniref:Uncharacterized protein n=1 Tax=Trichoderma harzianum TaxID=5544 RepID=A0A0F9ZLP3_TRIHA|nr:hypothetical protein THAR02_06755 [Trichoderma harzianum]
MSPYLFALRLIQAFEDRIIDTVSAPRQTHDSLSQPFAHAQLQILRQPGFHRAVGRIHRAINEKQHGRNPHEPLAPGEATGTIGEFCSLRGETKLTRTAADPNPGGRADGFFKHFIGELKNQARGKPTDITTKPPTK